MKKVKNDVICFSPSEPDLKLGEDRLFYVDGKSPRSNNSSSTEEGNYFEALHFFILFNLLTSICLSCRNSMNNLIFHHRCIENSSAIR